MNMKRGGKQWQTHEHKLRTLLTCQSVAGLVPHPKAQVAVEACRPQVAKFNMDPINRLNHLGGHA